MLGIQQLKLFNRASRLSAEARNVRREEPKTKACLIFRLIPPA